MRQLVAMLAIGLVLGAGGCLFDVGNQPGEDLCLALVAVMGLPTLGIPLMLVGGIATTPSPVYSLLGLDFPAPPPRA
jgi:hypothetical protein